MDLDLLNHLLSTAARTPARPEEVEIAGADPVFPLPVRVGDAGAASIAAAALQAARLWQQRGGRAQRVHVDTDAATAAMRSSRYLKIEEIPGQPQPEVNWNSRGGGGRRMYQTGDGRWIYFQREFEYHRQRMCEVLQCEDNDESLTEACLKWQAPALEEAVLAAGATAGMVRSAAEWAAHPQGIAVAGLPTFEVIRISDSAPEPLTSGAARPLSGVRVLDLTRVLAGPTCARTLAEHGADVLRVSTNQLPDDPAQAIDTGHGKRGADIDLNKSDGMAQLKALIREADVFSQAFRPGSLAARGLGPEQVAALRPGIIYCTLSAFSHEGPWRDRRGFDSVVQAVCGISDEIARDGAPRSLPMNPLDYMTGYIAAFGIMAALERRAAEGGSYLVRVSLAQTAHWLCRQSRVDPAQSAGDELAPERLQSLMTTSRTPYGMLTHLAPIAQLSETPGRWELPSAPLSRDGGSWLPR